MFYFVFYGLIWFVVYLVLYWIGFVMIKGLSMGNVIIMLYLEFGVEEDVVWWEF